MDHSQGMKRRSGGSGQATGVMEKKPSLRARAPTSSGAHAPRGLCTEPSNTGGKGAPSLHQRQLTVPRVPRQSPPLKLLSMLSSSLTPSQISPSLYLRWL